MLSTWLAAIQSIQRRSNRHLYGTIRFNGRIFRKNQIATMTTLSWIGKIKKLWRNSLIIRKWKAKSMAKKVPKYLSANPVIIVGNIFVDKWNFSWARSASVTVSRFHLTFLSATLLPLINCHKLWLIIQGYLQFLLPFHKWFQNTCHASQQWIVCFRELLVDHQSADWLESSLAFASLSRRLFGMISPTLPVNHELSIKLLHLDAFSSNHQRCK